MEDTFWFVQIAPLFQKKVASHIQNQLRNQGFPIGVSGVITWHQPKQRIIIRAISQNHHWFALFDHDPPQNGCHLMTPEYWICAAHRPFYIKASGLVTWWVLKRTRYPRANRLAVSTTTVETVGPLPTSTWWNPCTHECCQNADEDEINKLSYHMMFLRANEDRCNLALILKARICE